ncbi:hypothetical protein CXG81DRAFT_28994 [Caulochytrium protostelioides]|uniref:Uncharacterized protein n=1 Tax=Caulochytrium protostelioides TaxID=1555241 RepID=A0A4P9WX91_9FUNG|nr:hypothetical protein CAUPRSCDRAFT_12258 [Caulochytrium protostelioides]RKO98209.1 hypothetical protein CXG81DRAFT_28994 [Caulochytrium protostelioides]|eukprot:RKO98209.1 hypothetical protein CXG81DRAFT_28994 [Caulochytrium protostelioides]
MADAEGVSVGSADTSSDTSTNDTSVVSVPAKRRRPDLAEKLKERKNQTETVVKAALFKYLQSDDKRLVRDAIRGRVEAFSQRYHIASIALSGLLKRCFMDGVLNVMDTQLPDLTNLSFYQQLMLGCI